MRQIVNRVKRGLVASVALCALTIVASAPSQAGEKVLNFYNWNYYIGPNVISGFEKETGIKVNYDTYDSNESLEAKLSAGRSGYDLAVPTLSPFLARGANAGLYQAIDKSKLSNLGNLDPALLKTMSKLDPGNNFALPWVTAADVIGFDTDKVKKLAPDAPIGSIRMLFDPEIVSKFKSCGVTVLDSATDVIPMAMIALGRDPNSENPDDLNAAVELMLKIRPYIRKFDSTNYINDLADGGTCLSLGWATDIALASRRASQAKKNVRLASFIPNEGSITYVDVIAIPSGAPNIENAYKFIDYFLRPDVSAENTNDNGGRTGNLAALPLIGAQYTSDPTLFPDAETQARLTTLNVASKEYERLRTRAWTRIKTGR